jgi:Ser/Thr protein kinase RdoA (MazF antagonist)
LLATELLPQLCDYLAGPGVCEALGVAPGPWRLAFLAQGEYNINYLLTDAIGQRMVLRVNTGTQIGQAGGAQIAYEAAALRLLGPAGVAPRLLALDDTLSRLPYGLLLMEYLPGGPLRYGDPAHLDAAAATLARLHDIPAPTDGPFIRRRPLVDDLAEARGWLAPYLACARAPSAVRALFERALARAAADAGRFAGRFPTPWALVHTDVQAHNWVVDDGQEAADGGRSAEPAGVRCRLVDWERPLIDDPSYDLVHFLLPTTTRWKCGYTFSEAERERFLERYCAARPDLEADELRERVAIRWPFILLRALGWCAGAWVEYTGPGRALDNRDTLATIEDYLRPAALEELFGEWLY